MGDGKGKAGGKRKIVITPRKALMTRLIMDGVLTYVPTWDLLSVRLVCQEWNEWAVPFMIRDHVVECREIQWEAVEMDHANGQWADLMATIANTNTYVFPCSEFRLEPKIWLRDIQGLLTNPRVLITHLAVDLESVEDWDGYEPGLFGKLLFRCKYLTDLSLKISRSTQQGKASNEGFLFPPRRWHPSEPTLSSLRTFELRSNGSFRDDSANRYLCDVVGSAPFLTHLLVVNCTPSLFLIPKLVSVLFWPTTLSCVSLYIQNQMNVDSFVTIVDTEPLKLTILHLEINLKSEPMNLTRLFRSIASDLVELRLAQKTSLLYPDYHFTVEWPVFRKLKRLHITPRVEYRSTTHQFTYEVHTPELEVLTFSEMYRGHGHSMREVSNELSRREDFPFLRKKDGVFNTCETLVELRFDIPHALPCPRVNLPHLFPNVTKLCIGGATPDFLRSLGHLFPTIVHLELEICGDCPDSLDSAIVGHVEEHTAVVGKKKTIRVVRSPSLAALLPELETFILRVTSLGLKTVVTDIVAYEFLAKLTRLKLLRVINIDTLPNEKTPLQLSPEVIDYVTKILTRYDCQVEFTSLKSPQLRTFYDRDLIGDIK